MLNQLTRLNVPAGPDLFGLQDSMRQFFLDPYRMEMPRDAEGNVPRAWRPRVDVIENDDAFRLVAELPGVNSDNVQITIENNVLTIRGERPEVSNSDYEIHRSERYFGPFERTFTLPSNVETEHVDASYADGILTVSLAKTERARARQIPVKAGNTQA